MAAAGYIKNASLATLNTTGVTTLSGSLLQPIKSFSTDDNGDLEITDSSIILIKNAMSGNRVITLPSATTANGVNYMIKITVDLSGTLNFVSNATNELFIGGVSHIDTDTDNAITLIDTQILSGTAKEGIQLAADTKAGSWIDLVCDGSEWYINGSIYAHTAPTYVDI